VQTAAPAPAPAKKMPAWWNDPAKRAAVEEAGINPDFFLEPTTDVTDPFPSGTVDPDSYLCVVPGHGMAPAPVASPAPSETPTEAPTEAPTETPEPEPDLPVTGPAPGMIPTDESPVGPNVPPVPPGSGGSGPNDGGDPPPNLPPPPVESDPVQGRTITRDEVIGRAVSWVLQQVPYSQTSWWSDSNGTYRQDCSGYVSMAWNLNQRTNYWTGNLASVSHRIATSALKPGDILLLPRSHVVIFAGWGDSARTRFHLYEEYSRGKPARYVTNASLSYYLNRGYGAYRYDRIADVARGRPGPQSRVYELTNLSSDLGNDLGSDVPSDDLSDPTVDMNDGVVDIAGQVQPVAWSEALAEDVDGEAAAPDGADDQFTPDAVPQLPIETLVETQQATDQRAFAAAGTREPSSGAATALLAAGIGLLFLGFPLSAAARAGVWLPWTVRPEETS
jgi:hypothetical protein